jgi:hypothetical protein
MNSADLCRIKREFTRTRRHLSRMTLHRRLHSGLTTAFWRDSEQCLCRTGDPGMSLFLVLMEGKPFKIDDHLYHVETILPSRYEPKADLLIVREHECGLSTERLTRRALQIRDLEHLLKQGRVHLRCGSHTLASPRLGFGGVA